MSQNNIIEIVMGSASDLEKLKSGFSFIKKYNIPCNINVISAHRNSEEIAAFSKNAENNGTKVIIAIAGMAAHFAGVVASHTIIPVIGVPVSSKDMGGIDTGSLRNRG